MPDARRIGRRNVVKRLQAIEGEPGRSVYAGGAATFEREDEVLTVRPAFGMSHERHGHDADEHRRHGHRHEQLAQRERR